MTVEHVDPRARTCPEPACGQELAHERHGDETVYMCPEHGWQATIFEEGSGS
jgi:hypothetical protein